MSANDGEFPVLMPKVGQVMETGTLLQWLKTDGDRVERGEVIAEVETDKVTFELESPAAGVLQTRVAEGDEVEVDGLVAVVNAEEGSQAAAPQPREAAAPSDVQSSPHRATTRPAPASAAPGPRRRRVPASPKAQRLARELGIDLASVQASAADGVISAGDVEAAAAAAKTSDATRTTGSGERAIRERRRLTGIRRTAARRLTESWNAIPHIVQMIDVNAEGLLAARARLREAGTEVSFNDVMIRAAADALGEHPDLNATLEGDELVLFEGVDAGFAVDTPRGLVVPVIRDVLGRSMESLADEARRLVAAARDGALRAGDVGSASFTLSNLGAWGIRAGTPVISPGEPMTIFAGVIDDRPVAEDGQIVLRPTLTLSIAFDHRVTDGAAAAAFTRDVKRNLENLRVSP